MSDIGLAISLKQFLGLDLQFLCHAVYVSRRQQNVLAVDAAPAAHGAMKPEGFIRPDFHAVKIVYDFF